MMRTRTGKRHKYSLFFGIATAILLGNAVILQAEPYIAVRTGFKCSQCHMNGTGGGMRTPYGTVYSQYKTLIHSAARENASASFDPNLNPAISIGGNFRVEQVRSQEYKSGGKSAPGSDMMNYREANVYANIELVKGFLSAYIDETVAPAPANREIFAIVSLPGNGWFKFGNMLLPYGYRIMDDQAFIRNIPNYNYNRSAVGYEAGWEPGPFSLVANLGSENFSSVGSVIFNGLPVIRSIRLGGTYGSPVRKKERRNNSTYGVFGGLTFGMFTLLGERDWTERDSVQSIADYFEIDFLPARGLNFKFVYEYLWPNRDIPRAQNGRDRITLGAEPFVTQFFQIGLYYRANRWIPQALEANQDEWIGRLHVFF